MWRNHASDLPGQELRSHDHRRPMPHHGPENGLHTLGTLARSGYTRPGRTEPWKNTGSNESSPRGQRFANQIRRRLPRVGDKWHLHEVAPKIAGVKHWLWRAVDQTGVVLDVLVQRPTPTRQTGGQAAAAQAAKEADATAPRHDTDKLASYDAAKREIMPVLEHRQHKGLSNRAENSHQPTRRRERQMKQFKSAGQAQAVPLSPRSDQ
jgi:DDE domain